ncbi:MAG: septal ring lytic transglycosylase RlpA family protein [Gammaproteobacteria bacterium]
MTRQENARGLRPIVQLATLCIFVPIGACSFVSSAYQVTKQTVRTTYTVTKTAVVVGIGTGRIVYRVGRFTFDVVKAPLTWPLLQGEIETIDNLSPKEAIRQGRIKASPYVVKGKRYVPFSGERAKHYREEGIASWYGYETRRQKGGHMTANGEAFDPMGFTAAHKYLPLPSFVRVTNLDNRRSMILRVNDRGPFVQGRIIDVSAGAAKKLGFYSSGLTRVRVEVIDAEG